MPNKTSPCVCACACACAWRYADTLLVEVVEGVFLFIYSVEAFIMCWAYPGCGAPNIDTDRICEVCAREGRQAHLHL